MLHDTAKDLVEVPRLAITLCTERVLSTCSLGTATLRLHALYCEGADRDYEMRSRALHGTRHVCSISNHDT